jgi:pyridoxamine 5'-phosphate oxidase
MDILDERSIEKNPLDQFSKWYKAVQSAGFIHPDSVVLATSTKDGKPSARVVLLKGFDERGFIFFTNYNSRKGKELKENPFACMLFYLDKLDKQVRIEGRIKKISRSESNEYFHSRPEGSQLGAWVSEQSSVIKNRGVLEKKFSYLEKKYKGKEIPLPEFWGGYRLVPTLFEFWQSRTNRLHDRIRYTLKNKKWMIERLAP